ncbi:uncharacterized protein LOC143460883 [Clavelina lepadiformis]|uniref:uncharacterized protein LOC143460883 n=1 Tax=Clavelina lepadiformis TaxID=159417 RepID=UPI0040421C09
MSEKILHQISFIKTKLKRGDYEAILCAIKELIPLNTKELSLDYNKVIEDVLEVSKMLCDKLQHLMSLSLIMFAADLCSSMTSNEDKMLKLDSCSHATMEVVIALRNTSRKDEIEKGALVSHMELLKALQSVNDNIDKEHKAYLLCKCFNRIGTTYYFIGKGNEAIENAKAGISVLDKAFGSNAKQFVVYGGCHYIAGKAYHCMRKYLYAVHYFQKTLEMYNSVKDLDKEAMKKNIELAKVKMDRAQSLQPPDPVDWIQTAQSAPLVVSSKTATRTSPKPASSPSHAPATPVAQPSRSNTLGNLQQTVETIKQKLDAGIKEDRELLHAFQALFQADLPALNSNCEPLIKDIISISDTLRDNLQHKLSLTALVVASDVCNKLSNPDNKMYRLNDCGHSAANTIMQMFLKGEVKDIGEIGMPILKELHERISATETDSVAQKAFLLSKFLSRIGSTLFYIQKYEEAGEYCSAGLSVMTQVFGQHAKEFVISGACCYQAGESYRFIRKFDRAAELFQIAIEMYEGAQDVGEAERKKCIDLSRDKLQKSRARQFP